ncbi:SDR family oxidoreductase [Brevundimonas sp. AJA228-03]|uniref:SDR family oxidoreductase n=1 Tax=Brevundimonas sp. AJA228-03 TaxID=2752515 RepID=UPI001ADF377F|nr:SDR family oxidoreductase [Brevundimonas sp. AJA228-03]QTN18304.1 SDR family oxidoreductase [Brevundimonas sp. AJA228-03]
MDIEGSAAIVTGANRGIGEGFVHVLIEHGAARVYAGARDPASARHLEDRYPGKVVAVRLDVSKPDEIEAAAAACPDVSILVNNAGAFHNKLLIGSDDISAARDEMEVNYFGPLQMARAFAPVLKANGGGAILNVLSVGGIVAVPNMGGYSPSKFAMRAAGSCIRAELAGQGTSVTSLIVGSVDTRMASHVKGAKEQPEDIARAALKGITRGIDEIDTDRFAIESRAALARDPKGMERAMARMLHVKELSTGR